MTKVCVDVVNVVLGLLAYVWMVEVEANFVRDWPIYELAPCHRWDLGDIFKFLEDNAIFMTSLLDVPE